MHRAYPKSVTFALSSLLCVLLCCTPAVHKKVTAKSLPGIDFSQYRTYKWVTVASTAKVDEAVDQRVKQGVDARMSEKHFTKVDTGPANLDLKYQLSLREDQMWAGFDPHGGTSWANIEGGQGQGDMKVQVGTLVLDMYDSTRQQLVWHGRATRTFDQHDNNEETRHKSLNEAIVKLMKKFPPEQ